MDEMDEMLQEFYSNKVSSSQSVNIIQSKQPVKRPIEIPKTITTSDKVFSEDILSEIIEKDFDDDDEEDIELNFQINSMGFPKASLRLNAQENDLETKPLLNNTEKESKKGTFLKGNWSNENTLETISGNSIRFDFQGIRISDLHNYDSNSGLFHHGEDPNSAGYDIKELAHLSKSTFPTQRAFAFQILTSIVLQLYSKLYSNRDENEIWTEICTFECLFCSRIGLDSSHRTVVDASLRLIAVFFGFKTDLADIWDDYTGMRSGYRSFSLKSTSIKALQGIQTIEKQDRDNTESVDFSVAAIKDYFQTDPILGLLLTDVVSRLRYIFSNDSAASSSTRIEIVFILYCVAKHSPSSAEDVLSCDGLVETIYKSIFATPASMDHIYITTALRLFYTLCVSSSDACKALDNHGVISGLVQLLALDSMVLSNFTIIFNICGVAFGYGIAPRILADFRSLFTDFLHKLAILIFENPDKIFSSDIISVYNSLTKCLESAINSFGHQLDIGGKDDAMAPFAALISNILEYMNGASLVMDTSSIQFLLLYFRFALRQQQPSESSMSLMSTFRTCFPKLVTRADAPNLSFLKNECLQPQFEVLTAVLNESRIEKAKECINLSNRSDYLAALCSGIVFMSKQNWLDCRADVDEFLNEKCFDLCTQKLMETEFPRKDWIRIFCQGVCNYLLAYSYMIHHFRKRFKTFQSGKSLNEVGFFLLHNFLLPGDDYLLPQIANFLFHSVTLRATFISTLMNEKAMIGHFPHILQPMGPRKFPSQFMVPANNSNETSFPIRVDWHYKHLTDLYQTQVHHLNTKSGTLSFSEEHIQNWLELLQNIEDGRQSIAHLSKAEKYMHLGKGFLLCDSNTDPVFRIQEISKLLDKIMTIIDDSSFVKSTQPMPSEFSLTYELLLDKFAADSFGDTVFKKFIFILERHITATGGAIASTDPRRRYLSQKAS